MASRPLKSEWQELLQHLQGMCDDIEHNKVELNAFADKMLSMFESYHQAIEASGKQSVRIEAALKSLDLRTKRSELERFVSKEHALGIMQ